MTTSIATIVNQYEQFLTAGTSYGKALQQAVSKNIDCPKLLQALAAVHAKHYKCNTTWNEQSHRATFHTGAESTRETRCLAAQKSWSRNVTVHFNTTRGEAKPAKRKSEVEMLLAKFAKLSKADQRQFLKSIA